MSRLKKESYGLSTGNFDIIKKALSRMQDALGMDYTDFGDVMSKLDDMRVDLRPTKKEIDIILLFKKQSTDQSRSSNPAEFWIKHANDCNDVLSATRLYWEGNRQQFTGVEAIKNRILFLANRDKWK